MLQFAALGVEVIGLAFGIGQASRQRDATREALMRARKAQQRFVNTFGFARAELPLETWIGRRTYSSPTGYHMENQAAGLAINNALTTARGWARVEVPNGWGFTCSRESDWILVGGCTSTPFSRMVFENFGKGDYDLDRTESPVLTLPYFGLSAEDRIVADVGRAAWVMEGIGPVVTANWPFVHIDPVTGKEKELICPMLSNSSIVAFEGGHRGSLLLDNYLLVTRLPNFLSFGFNDAVEKDSLGKQGCWPYLTIFDGNHGVGTSAVDLLSHEGGREALEAFEREYAACGSPQAYQALFRVTDIGDDQGYHRPNHIEYRENSIESLDTITTAQYRKAHDIAMDRLWNDRSLWL